jgi:hypothetical protein
MPGTSETVETGVSERNVSLIPTDFSLSRIYQDSILWKWNRILKIWLPWIHPTWNVCIQITWWMPRQITFSETFRSKLEEIQTQAPPLRLRICPATGNARSFNANYIRGGVNKFSNPLPSILKRAAYQGTRVRQFGINVGLGYCNELLHVSPKQLIYSRLCIACKDVNGGRLFRAEE